jgi:hypothetical protein
MGDYVVYEPNTEKTRFDLTTMMQEWHDFLLSQCGYEKADPALVAVLTFEHSKVFAEILKEGTGISWNDIEGRLLVPAELDQSMKAQGLHLDLGQLDVIWADAFNEVNERFDEIESDLYDESCYKLI